MKNILVVSDTHGGRRALLALRERMLEADFVFHLGDMAQDIAFLAPVLSDKLFTVNGNSDGESSCTERVVEAEGVRMLLTHGHRYGVKSGLDRLRARMEELGVRVAFFGHTHQAGIYQRGGLTLINPGSVRFPLFGKPSYGYCTVYNGKVLAKNVEIEE